MSALTGQPTEANLRELARIIRGIHARTAARLERERLARERQDGEPGAGDDGEATR